MGVCSAIVPAFLVSVSVVVAYHLPHFKKRGFFKKAQSVFLDMSVRMTMILKQLIAG